MKKISIISVILLVTTLNSCNFKKDLITGATIQGKGLECDDISIEINGEIEKRNTYIYGEKVFFVFDDITGLKKEEGKVYPGFSMHVVKNEKDTVLVESNLLRNLENGTDLSPLQLRASLVTGLPYKNNEKYKLHLKIWDRKGEGTLSYKMPFQVKESDLLTIKSTEISYSAIYLWNESQNKVLKTHTVDKDDKLLLSLEKIEGLEEVNEKVYPSLSIELTGNDGKKIIANPNLFSANKNGFNAKEFKEKQLPITIQFEKGQFFNPYQLKVVLSDTKSDKKIIITTALEIN